MPTAAIGPHSYGIIIRKIPPTKLDTQIPKTPSYPYSTEHVSCTLSWDLVRKQWEGGRQKKRKGGGERIIHNYMYV